MKKAGEETTVIEAESSLLDMGLGELFGYRDLIILFVKKNFATRYKQTVLGPLWIVLSPLLTAVVSTVVFGEIAEIPSEGVPYFLFYMCGNTVWSFFSACLFSVSSTFVANARLFGKVWFPRLTVPVSAVITGMIDFAVQLVMFLCFYIYFFFSGADISVRPTLALLPLLLLQTAALAMGFGMLISALTAKYRDLSVAVNLLISLWMYATPIIYSAEALPSKLKTVCMLNPMSPVIEAVKNGFFGTGGFPVGFWLISMGVTAAVLAVGVIVFGRVEKTFTDTV